MATLIIVSLIGGIIIGLLLATLSLWLIKIKCPKCKQLKPLPEIIRFRGKFRQITGQICQKCQRPKPQIDL